MNSDNSSLGDFFTELGFELTSVIDNLLGVAIGSLSFMGFWELLRYGTELPHNPRLVIAVVGTAQVSILVHSALSMETAFNYLLYRENKTVGLVSKE